MTADVYRSRPLARPITPPAASLNETLASVLRPVRAPGGHRRPRQAGPRRPHQRIRTSRIEDQVKRWSSSGSPQLYRRRAAAVARCASTVLVLLRRSADPASRVNPASPASTCPAPSVTLSSTHSTPRGTAFALSIDICLLFPKAASFLTRPWTGVALLNLQRSNTSSTPNAPHEYGFTCGYGYLCTAPNSVSCGLSHRMITGMAATSAAITHDRQFVKPTFAAELQSATASVSRVAAKTLRKLAIGLFANQCKKVCHGLIAR